jgi:hypothetical protein
LSLTPHAPDVNPPIPGDFTCDSPVAGHPPPPVSDQAVSVYQRPTRQNNYKSGQGILVFDIDQTQVCAPINISEFQEGLRGFTGNLKTHSAYFHQ